MSQNKIEQTRELSDEELRKLGVVVNPDYKYVLGIFPVKEYKVANSEQKSEFIDGIAKTENEGIWFSGSKRKTRRNKKKQRKSRVRN